MLRVFLGLFLIWSVVMRSVYSQELPILSFDEGYNHLYGGDNLVVHRDRRTVHLSLDERTGSGFVSQDVYLHGFFSASIKLPADYSAGVVVAFYMSNVDQFEKTHDEIDFEFLGNIHGRNWRVQTNIYGNGSTGVGREERYGLWFNPAEDFHQYSILWTNTSIKFSIDSIPIREVKRRGDFPSKPMSLYATIWDASDWATNGGKYRVNYKYAPYIAEFTDLVLHGCAVDPLDQSTCGTAPPTSMAIMTPKQKTQMENFRKKHMTYSYCYDRTRYKVAPPECVTFDPALKFGNRRRHRHRTSI